MFIEVTAYNGKTLVNTALVTYVERSTDDEYTILWFADGNDCVRCNETYNEVVRKIAEGERVVAGEGQKDQEKWPHWSDMLSEFQKREAEKLMEELLDDK